MAQPTKVIAIIGSLNMDLVTVTPRMPDGGETLHASSFHTGAGGKGGNQAVAAARLSSQRPKTGLPISHDIKVKMIAAVGDDDFGQSLLRGLQEDGIETEGVKVREGVSSGIASIIVEEKTGENRILLVKGANATLLPEDLPTAESLGSPLPDVIIMQLEIPIETVHHILNLASTSSIPVVFNPAPAVLLPDATYKLVNTLVVNESEAALLGGLTLEQVSAPDFAWSTLATTFLEKGVENIIITLGSKGAFLKTSSGEAMILPEKVERVIDTTAAGDTFVGALAVNILRNEGGNVTEESVKMACRAAEQTIQRAGAQNSIPWGDEVPGFSRKQ